MPINPFSVGRKNAIIHFASVSDAANALATRHNHEIDGVQVGAGVGSVSVSVSVSVSSCVIHLNFTQHCTHQQLAACISSHAPPPRSASISRPELPKRALSVCQRSRNRQAPHTRSCCTAPASPPPSTSIASTAHRHQPPPPPPTATPASPHPPTAIRRRCRDGCSGRGRSSSAGVLTYIFLGWRFCCSVVQT